MQIERTKNATRNIFWGIMEKIVTLLLPFVVRTVLIKTLGAEYLGLSGLFTSILSVLNVTELGFGTAIVFSMYKPIAEDDNASLCALLNFYKKIYHIVGMIIFTGGLVVLPFLPHFIKGSYPNDVNIYVLYLVYLFNTAIGYFLFAYKVALFKAHQRNDLISKRGIVLNFLSNVLQIILLLSFKNYYAYVIVLPLITIITNLVNAYIAKKFFPNIICAGTISKETKDGIKKRITGLISYKIYGVIFSSVDTIVISSFLGLIPLAKFNSYFYVQSAIIGFITIFTSSITAGIGNKMVTSTRQENYKDFKNLVFINAWISSFCAVSLFCLYQHFIEWWVGKELLFSFDTMTLMVLYFLLSRISVMTYTYREAAGLWWEDRFRPLIAAVVNLSINLILVQFIGINGVIISTLICTIFINIPWGSAVLFKNYFKRSPAEYFFKLLLYVLVTAGSGAVTFFICNLLHSQGFGFMLLKGVICLIVPNALFCLVYHKAQEFEYVKKLAKNSLKGIKRKAG